MISNSPNLGLMREPLVDEKGNVRGGWQRWFSDTHKKLSNVITLAGQLAGNTGIQGRSGVILGITQELTDTGLFSSLDKVQEGAIFGKTKQIALTSGAVDLSKTGVVGAVSSAKIGDQQVLSSKIIQNVMGNYSNNATVDSVDNGVDATIRVYGTTGGVGTTWHQFIGAEIGPEIPALSSAGHAYSSDFYVYYDGTSYFVTQLAYETLPDGILFSGSVTTVASGGGGGSSGGGGGGGGGGGSQRK
jgi:hypothetical protein